MNESGMKAISMVDLDRTLSLSVARARQHPVLVKNRHKPWVWLVSHETWRRERQYLEYISDSHPLVVLRQLLEPFLGGPCLTELRELASVSSLQIGLPVLCRALCLQAVYAIPTVRSLYENIGYNMAYRHFVGVDTSLNLWPFADFEREIGLLKEHPTLAVLIDHAIAQCAKFPADAGFRFQGEASNDQDISVDMPETCCGGLKCLPPRVR